MGLISHCVTGEFNDDKIVIVYHFYVLHCLYMYREIIA